MKASNSSKGVTNRSGPHKKVTYTFPPEVIAAVDEQWRFHKTLDASLADSKSEYIADLIRRDAVRKTAATQKR
jgi:hypothetical protein